jgi:DNA modification methylase
MTKKQTYSSGKIDQVQLDDMVASERAIGQIYPVLKDQRGQVIDGCHRKRVDPNWKEVVLPISDPLESLKLRVHLNIMRRKVPEEEKSGWIADARKLLEDRDLDKVTQHQIAESLGMTDSWVKKYDPIQHYETSVSDGKLRHNFFFGYNVWGFKDETWRKLIVPADPNQPCPNGYHGATPAFVMHQLVAMFEPKRVLDSMAGVGTTGYVCDQHGIPCDQFDLYPFPKYGVYEADAEAVDPGATYDLIFNHIPYLNMVRYGESPKDLSNLGPASFFEKLRRVFTRNHELLNPGGVYVLLVGDWRHDGKVVPITAETTIIGLDTGFTMHDEAIKLTGEMTSKSLQEYRAAKFGYLAQTYDTLLMFRRS